VVKEMPQGGGVAKDYRELLAWQRAMDLTETVYRLTAGLPAEERFGLVSQLRRAAVSVPSCLAEGNARSSTRDYLRFVNMAAGSLAEMRTQLMLATRLGFAPDEQVDPVLHQLTRVTMLVQALKKALISKLAAPSRSRFPVPGSRST